MSWVLGIVFLMVAAGLVVLAMVPFIGSAVLVASMLILAAKYRGDWVLVLFPAGMIFAIVAWDLALDWWETRRRS